MIIEEGGGYSPFRVDLGTHLRYFILNVMCGEGLYYLNSHKLMSKIRKDPIVIHYISANYHILTY